MGKNLGLPKIALGTAQWGLEYGIAGHPKASKGQIKKILALAALNDIRVLDTAHQYGNALDILGCFHKIIKKHQFRIILKIPEIPKNLNLWMVQDLKSRILTDLVRLKVDYVDTMMIHNPQALIGSGADLAYDLLLNMKYLGFCKQIGISLYTPEELRIITHRYSFDVVSFPCNVLDQRFDRQQLIDYMLKLRIEMQARSLFLQGLLLMPYHVLMDKLTWEFRRVIKRLTLKFKGDMLKACIAYFRQLYPVNYGVFGVHSVEQFQAIITSYNEINSWYDFDQYEIRDLRVIDPRRW